MWAEERGAVSRREDAGEPSRLTRAEFVRRGVTALAAPMVFGGSFLRVRDAPGAAHAGALVIGADHLAQVRRNIFQLKLGFARRAWANTVTRAESYLGYHPTPTRADADVSDWRAAIYVPGLHDGNAAVTLATAYAVGAREDYARRAKAICLAWARAYRPAPPLHMIGHMVAEPVGPVVKLCMAYDLAKPIFSTAERAEFRSWAAQFVQRGRINADYARDRPWVSEVTYGSDRTNPVPYGNSATWQRAMAVFSAAVVGGTTLEDTLAWNFQHTTNGGLAYGWDDLLEGLIIDGSGGQVIEDRYRSSIEYGHFSWIPVVLVADLARNAGFRIDLFRYRTMRHGYTVFTPVAYYARFLSKTSIPATLEQSQYGGQSWPATAARWRAAYELLYRNATDAETVRMLRRLVNYGGPGRRGDNYDVYALGHAALFGRGPKGPRAGSAGKRSRESR
jgi:hypothetical protein